MQSYYSNGKLLLTAEYVVLDGATALALPTRFGQALEVLPRNDNRILWKSRDEHGKVWFEEEFRISEEKLEPMLNQDPEISERLASILSEAHRINSEPLSGGWGYDITAELNFSRNWGLGSSSTLINNIAQWFEMDAYWLLKKTFGGSGYDIAAAQHDLPILYSLEEGKPTVLTTTFDPDFKDQLFFVHLNRKQNSRESIEHYRAQSPEQLQPAIEKITGLTHQILACRELEEFELLLEIHETLISQLIKTPKVKSSRFPDYPRSIKSLGGWGGDFILATGGEAERAYFRGKGYATILGFSEMVLGPARGRQELRF